MSEEILFHDAVGDPSSGEQVREDVKKLEKKECVDDDESEGDWHGQPEQQPLPERMVMPSILVKGPHTDGFLEGKGRCCTG